MLETSVKGVGNHRQRRTMVTTSKIFHTWTICMLSASSSRRTVDSRDYWQTNSKTSLRLPVVQISRIGARDTAKERLGTSLRCLAIRGSSLTRLQHRWLSRIESQEDSAMPWISSPTNRRPVPQINRRPRETCFRHLVEPPCKRVRIPPHRT